MLRSLYTGVEGLKTHQTKMDVIGNNIANVNTVAYKSNQVSFKNLLYQTVQNAKGANAATNTAATNARQVGLGTAVGGITSSIATQGSTQTTNNPLDLTINGTAFFIVNDGQQNLFTKAGNFYVDAAGYLAMTSNGYTVMGWQPNDDGTDIVQGAVSRLQIMKAANQTVAGEATTNATVSGTLDVNSDNMNTTSGQKLAISFYDANGNPYLVNLYITKNENSATTGAYNITIGDLIDSSTGDVMQSTNGNNATGTLYYNPSTGEYIGGNLVMTLDGTGTTGNAATFNLPNGITLDFSNTNIYNNNGISTISATAGDADGLGTGHSAGTLKGFSVQQDGKIVGSYSNGTEKLLGQISVATFTNPTGLEKVGDNLYQTSPNSGAFDGIGVDITAGGVGSITSGTLEMSNVDLSTEFTEMITTQRGFQVNSRVITVSDSMLQTLEELKR